MAKWNEYKYENGSPYEGDHCPDGYYGDVATMTLVKIPEPDNKIVYLWHLVLKNPKLNGVARKFDWDQLKYYSDAKLEGNDVIFKGTSLDCSNMYEKLWEQGYQVQDDFILKTYD
tara:strand:+ start:252 stop:596 length:345 start_codon:yes stop_codon:yes gene_type:complete